MIRRQLLRPRTVYAIALLGGATGLLTEPRAFAAPPVTSTRAASELATLTTSSLLEGSGSGSIKQYAWKTNIVGTVFWVGELPTENNPVPNTGSSWDPNWMKTFGGYDDPDTAARHPAYRPAGFVPKLNPFYVALPYNDCVDYKTTKTEASKVIPWYKETFVRQGKSVCHNRWVAIRFGNRTCYAQWSDCGPFVTTDAAYVFGESRPVNTKNKGAGIDLAPAVRDYLGFRSGQAVDWRFVEESEVPNGPWRDYGKNNPFSLDAAKVASMPSYTTRKSKVVQPREAPASFGTSRPPQSEVARLEELRRQRDLWFSQNGVTTRLR